MNYFSTRSSLKNDPKTAAQVIKQGLADEADHTARSDGKTDADEYIMLSLRLAGGLSVRQLAEKWGLKIGAHTTAKLKVYRENDFLTFDGDNIKLTPKGFLAENTIARDIMSDLYDI